MQEELISFETAKLAKEKGFDESCDNVFKDTFETRRLNYFEGDGEGFVKNSNINTEYEYFTHTAPTQSLLQKWLREVHNIYVNSYHDLSSNGTNIRYYTSWGFIGSKDKSDNYNSNGWFDEHGDYLYYEESLEFGLQEALKLIK